ncbi:1935_t:CDS:2 [Funneliformis geosporum]|nr:1935_t:CDS:2 [Funneliformis geosporum]
MLKIQAFLYSQLQANIVDIGSKKILEACKGNGILSKNTFEWYYPPNTSHRSLIPNPEDDYILPIFFWRPEKFYNCYVPTIPCATDSCSGTPKSKGWADEGARLIYGLNQNVLLRSWSYSCEKCKISFYAHDERILQKLPDHVRLELVNEMMSVIPDIGKFAQKIQENHMKRYLRLQQRYYEHYSEKYQGSCPSSTLIRECFLEYFENNMEEFCDKWMRSLSV